MLYFFVITGLITLKYTLFIYFFIDIMVICLVEMREIKEIRTGKYSKDFEKWPEEAKKIENLRCFIILYGSEFKLKSLSIAGKLNV